MTYSKAFEETVPDILHAFQVNNCIGCKFADQRAILARKPCCTRTVLAEVKNGKCLSRNLKS